MLTTIIVTFNSEEKIKKSLESLRKKNFLEILIVDNDSKDKTFQILKKNFSDLQIIKNPINIGFSSACNQGAGVAKGDYLLFLNPDTLVKDESIEKMLKFLEEKENIGVVGCKVLNPDLSLQPSCGKFPNLLRIILDRIPFFNVNFGILIREKKFYNTTQVVDWVSGCCLLVKRKIFEEVGGFDENIFMYGEDYDLCFRVRKKGYINYYFADGEIIHQDSGTTNLLRKPHKYFLMRLGLLSFLKKNKSQLEYLILNYLVKFESIFHLILLTIKNRGLDEKKLWKRYLMKTFEQNA